MIIKLQSPAPERLGKDGGFTGDARIFLGMINRIDFAGSLGGGW